MQSGPLSSGTHSFVWDGTDESGLATTSGVYFYRLESAGRSETRSMVILK